MVHCTTLLIALTLGEHLQKWRMRYKTSDISEMKQSRAKLTTECLQKIVYGLPIGNKSGNF